MTRISAAESILKSLGITRADEIDLEAIAWHLGAIVKFRHIDAADATIVGSSDRAVISINSSHIASRQRFSLGHELGHWQHHRGKILFCGPSDIGRFAGGPLDPEQQADQFASDLILPGYLVRPKIRALKKISLASVKDIVDEFGASNTATLIKILNENCFPIILVCHSKAGRRWFKRATMIPTFWFPKSDLDSESMAFDLLFKGASANQHPSKIGAGAWFEFRNADRYVITEQSFSLPNNEILTVLTVPEEGLG